MLRRYHGQTQGRRESNGGAGRPHISAEVWLLGNDCLSKGPEVYAGAIEALVGGRGWRESRAAYEIFMHQTF